MFCEKDTMMRVETQHTQVLMAFHGSLYREVQRQRRMRSCVTITEESSTTDRQYVTLIETTLECLEEEYRRIIRNDFLEPQPKQWWMDYYAKSTYYRLKQRALEHFLRCLHG